MQQRVSLITLGVGDVRAAIDFYERLGWACTRDLGEVGFFQVGGLVLAVWGRRSLAEDSAVADPGGWGGVTLAHNVGTPEDVDRIIEQARVAGATVGREPAPTAWGGYSGVFVDPDGHPWEIAHNPAWHLADDGSVVLPPA